MLSVLAQVKQGLQSISKYGAQFNELHERIHSLSIELKRTQCRYYWQLKMMWCMIMKS